MPSDAALEEIWQQLWGRWRRAVRDRRAAYRSPALATVAPGPTPRLRTVILRAVDDARGQLAVQSDCRAAKVAELRQQPAASMLFWDGRHRQQVRVEGSMDVAVAGAEVEQAWQHLSAGGRCIYAGDRVPGSPREAPEPPRIEHEAPVLRDGARARAHFALLTLTVMAVDWLALDGAGQRRAIFHRAHPTGPWSQGWVQP